MDYITMVSLISKDNLLVDKLSVALKKSTGSLLNLDCKKIALEFLAQDRAVEQIELFISEVGKISDFGFKGKRLLEIGSGIGTFIITARKNYEIEAFGIEPSENDFSPFNEISSLLLKEYDLPSDLIIKGIAEDLPFENNSFDLIYSTNVLEHVRDPKKVFNESLRILKPGGFLQFVIPNYFSFWEGHYGVFWPCLINKFLAKLYTKLIGQNPEYINTLQLITPFYLKKILKKNKDEIEILGWGKEVFKKRLTSGNYSDWASLQKIRPVVSFIQKAGIAGFIADILNLFEMYTPIVITIRKK